MHRFAVKASTTNAIKVPRNLFMTPHV